MLRASTTRIDAILITHEHGDHVAGLDDICPFNIMLEMYMQIYANTSIYEVLQQKHPHIFASNYPSVQSHFISKDNNFTAAEIPIIPIEIHHGKLPILGFRVGDFAYLTDFKTIEDQEAKKLIGVKTLVISALQHKPHHSHSTLKESIGFVNKIGVEEAYFTHLSHKMGTHAETELLLPKHIQIAYDGQILNC